MSLEKMSYEEATTGLRNNTPRPPRVPGPVNDVKSSLERAATLCSRIEALANHLIGSVPEPGESTSDRDMPDGLFNELADKAHYLDRRVADAERALERIEKVAL